MRLPHRRWRAAAGSGSLNGTSPSTTRMPSAASAMSGEWAATDTGSSTTLRALQLARDFERGLDGRTLARDDDLAGGVPVGDADEPKRRPRSRAPARPRASSSPRIAPIAPGRPAPDACISRPRSRTSRRPSAKDTEPAATSALYWPIEWPALKVGRTSTPASCQRSRRTASIAIEVASSAGWAFTVRSRSSDGPSKASVESGSPRTRSASSKTAAAAGDASTSARPIPTRLGPLAGKDEGNAWALRGQRRGCGASGPRKSLHSCMDRC